MDVKKAAILTGAALLIFFLITQPVQAAGVTTDILGVLKEAAEAVVLFVQTVFAG